MPPWLKESKANRVADLTHSGLPFPRVTFLRVDKENKIG